MDKNESNRLDYASAKKNMNTPTTTRNRVLSPRGVLALLVPPSISAAADRNSNRNNSNSARHQLHYFDYDPCAPRLDPNMRIRRKKRYQELDVDLEDQYCDNFGQNQVDVNGHFPLPVPYHPHNGEFTLVFFCEMSCRNSNRISIMLANFMQAIQKDDDYYDVQGDETGVSPIQLICVPNDEIDMSEEQNRKSLMKGKPNILSHLASQTNFWCLGYDHVNRLAMIRMLSISMVPSLIVINNKSGRLITSWGIEAIEDSTSRIDGSKHLLGHWRKGKDGISCPTKLFGSCNIL